MVANSASRKVRIANLESNPELCECCNITIIAEVDKFSRSQADDLQVIHSNSNAPEGSSCERGVYSRQMCLGANYSRVGVLQKLRDAPSEMSLSLYCGENLRNPSTRPLILSQSTTLSLQLFERKQRKQLKYEPIIHKV
ncbi:hypothetical protein TNCV_3365531 [Trichonephila clavipes]|nr:hypothetical protein TNCV_3365531 [Trichonephila clavipes]